MLVPWHDLKATYLQPGGKSTCANVDRVKPHQESFCIIGHHPAALNSTG
jgi:hypothetical protein